ncbi:signal peptidase I [Streptomyces sp. NPDC048290]|uniref:signal peptidase I n=1 Tax=Streptomyces sp. NPDC048290 TaxID=3155811 RepID=UPI00344949C0
MRTGLPLLLVGLATAAGLLRRSLVLVTVQGASMEPTYHHGDRVLVRRTRALSTGQVVVVERPGPGNSWHHPSLPRGAGAVSVAGRQWMIKRVGGSPGDPVPRHVSHGQPVPKGHDPVPPDQVVPPGRLVLLGDNPDSSVDSRQLGYFPAARVLGVVLGGTGAPMT